MVTGREVTEIHIDAVIGRERHRLFPARRASESFIAVDVGVTVIADQHLVLLGECAQPFCFAHLAFGRNRACPQVFRRDKCVVDDVVAEQANVVDLDDLNQDARLLVLLAEVFDLVLVEGETPIRKFLRRFSLRRLLLGSQRRTSTAASATTAAAATAAAPSTAAACGACSRSRGRRRSVRPIVEPTRARQRALRYASTGCKRSSAAPQIELRQRIR